MTYQYSLIKFLRLSELNAISSNKSLSRAHTYSFGTCTRKVLAYFQRKLKNLEIFASIDEKSTNRYFTRKNRLLTNFARNIFNLTTISS